MLVDDCIISGRTMKRVYKFLTDVTDEIYRPESVTTVVLGKNDDIRHQGGAGSTPLSVFKITEQPFHFPWGQA